MRQLLDTLKGKNSIQLSIALFSRQLPMGGLVFEFGCGCSSPVVVVGLVFESGWIGVRVRLV